MLLSRASQPRALALAAAPCPNAFQDRLCFDAVISTFSPTGQLVFSSYLGGKFDEQGNDVALGPDGSIFLTGQSESLDFPTTAGSVQPAPRSGDEAFLARIGTAGNSGGGGNGGEAPPPANRAHRAYLPLVTR